MDTIAEPILIPQIAYLTNDAWELSSALEGPNGWPILLEAPYGGKLVVLTIPTILPICIGCRQKPK